MSNVYTFNFESPYDDDAVEFPVSSSITHSQTFDEGSTWVPILFQFCKFLESTGYVGVTSKVVIKGKANSGNLFESFPDADDDYTTMKEDFE
jgi:hypothetical protein